jgi:hypothetical protein
LTKVDVSGGLQWAKAFVGTGHDKPTTVLATQDEGYLVAASTDTAFTNSEGKTIKGLAMLLIKTDSQGQIGPGSVAPTWVTLYDNQVTQGEDTPWGLAEDNNYYILVGHSWKVDNDALILQINKSNGKIVQQKRFGTPKPGDESFRSLLVDTAGNYVITGDADSYGPSNHNVLFAKLSYADLSPIGLAKVYDDTLDQMGVGIKAASSGYAIAAWDASKDFLFLMTDQDGNLNTNSCRRYGGSGMVQDIMQAIDSTDKGIILAGMASEDYNPGYWMEMLVVKTNTLGRLECVPGLPFEDRNPTGLTETPFNLQTVAGDPLMNLTVTNLDDTDVGPGAAVVKVFQNSAATIETKDHCN